jgi:hypothetical protein
MPNNQEYDNPANTPLAWQANDAITAHALHQLNNLIATNKLRAVAGKAQPAFPKWNPLDPTQIPVHKRSRKSSTSLSKFCINRKHHLYDTWSAMLRRCYDRRCENYHKSYGAKNIQQPWTTRLFSGPKPGHQTHMNFLQYCFALEIAGRRTHPDDTIDRIRPDQGYHLPNMRWANKQIQANNKCVRTNPYGPWVLQSTQAHGFYQTMKKISNKAARSNKSNRRLYDMLKSLTPATSKRQPNHALQRPTNREPTINPTSVNNL